MVSLFSTSISITYSLLPKAYYFLPRRSCIDTITPFWRLPLPLLSREDDTGSGNGEISDPEQSKVRKEELKCATQLTLLLVSTSFSGFAAAFCLLSTTRQIASAQHFRTSKSRCASWLMLGGSVTGMFALLLCRLLSSNDKKLGTTWQRPEGSTRSLQQTSSWLPCIVSAALVLAETILHGLLVRRRRHVPGHRAGVAAWVLARRILLRA